MSRVLKLKHWKRRLADFVRAQRETPFAWGSWDCALAASSLLREITGVDPARAFRGRYVDEEGAARELRALGAGTFTETVAQLAAEHGWYEIGPSYARPGDLGLVAPPLGGRAPAGIHLSMGVLDLSAAEWLVAGLEGGFARLPRKSAQRAWRVG